MTGTWSGRHPTARTQTISHPSEKYDITVKCDKPGYLDGTLF